jgi:DNA-directed RNA polymerase specialized sigma subunit
MVNNSQGMPSILGEVPPPFSGKRVPGVNDEFGSMYTTWKAAPTPENNTKILGAVQPVIDTALSSYGGQQQSPTLKSRARLMALKALNTYDPERGNVRTHLLSQLQSLRRLTAKEQNIISIPEQVGLDYQHINIAENELRDTLNREPSDDELADHIGLSVRRIRKIRGFNQPIAAGTVSRETADDTVNTDIASNVPGAHRAEDAWMNFVYDDLSPTDKLIMDMTLGRNGRRRTSTQDIAKKLRVSSGAVSQRAAKIQDMLDKRYQYGGF